MTESIAPVPPGRWHEAIDLLVSQVPADVKPPQRLALHGTIASDREQQEGLLGDFLGGALTAVCWLQQQPGRVATLWPPAGAGSTDPARAGLLISLALGVARKHARTMVQALLPTDSGMAARALTQAGFRHVADLLYLVSAAADFPTSAPQSELRFVNAADISMAEFERIIERTYEGTLDCPALNGVRTLSDVLEGYTGVGQHRADLWLAARRGEQEVGCALVAHHAPEPVWELMYTGIVPEARGAGLGLEVTRYVQWLAALENVERLVLAVDTANEPAIAMYAAAGFVAWDRQSVYVHFM